LNLTVSLPAPHLRTQQLPRFGALKLQDKALPYFEPLICNKNPDGLYFNDTLVAQHADFMVNENFFNPVCHDVALRRIKIMIDRVNQLQGSHPDLAEELSGHLEKQEARDTLRMTQIQVPFRDGERIYCAFRLAKEWFMDTLNNPLDKFRGKNRGWSRPTEIIFGTFDLVCLPLTLVIMPILGFIYGGISGNPGIKGLTRMTDEIERVVGDSSHKNPINPGI
jgi:hypothetical protein